MTVDEFFRFPHTPHLQWLGEGQPRGDKILSPVEADILLRQPVVVEEKIDGANVGISVDENGEVRAQNRGAYLTREMCHPQFKPLFQWLALRRWPLQDHLPSTTILFGEWCYAVHSVRYTQAARLVFGFRCVRSPRTAVLEHGTSRCARAGAGRRSRASCCRRVLQVARHSEAPWAVAGIRWTSRRNLREMGGWRWVGGARQSCARYVRPRDRGALVGAPT